MPVFHGDLRNCLYRNVFAVGGGGVNSVGALSEAKTSHYLKAQVKGEPVLLLQSVAVTDANFVEAWELLNERCQDRRELWK
jgi:hypothetical protein